MIKYENDCVGCDLPCVNCGLKTNPHIYCDVCGEEIRSEVYTDEYGNDVCVYCHVKGGDNVD